MDIYNKPSIIPACPRSTHFFMLHEQEISDNGFTPHKYEIQWARSYLTVLGIPECIDTPPTAQIGTLSVVHGCVKAPGLDCFQSYELGAGASRVERPAVPEDLCIQ